MVLNAFFVESFWNTDKFILLMSIYLCSAYSAFGHERLGDSLDLIRSLAMSLLCLNLNETFRPEIESLMANRSTWRLIAQFYHPTEENFHNWLKKHEFTHIKLLLVITRFNGSILNNRLSSSRGFGDR